MSLSTTPQWLRRLDKAVSLTTNTIIVILLALGYTEDSLIMLLVKVGSSYLMNMLDIFLNDKKIVITKNYTLFPTKDEPQKPK